MRMPSTCTLTSKAHKVRGPHRPHGPRLVGWLVGGLDGLVWVAWLVLRDRSRIQRAETALHWSTTVLPCVARVANKMKPRTLERLPEVTPSEQNDGS